MLKRNCHIGDQISALDIEEIDVLLPNESH